MPNAIPFRPGEPEQILQITLDDAPYVLRARWNTRDAAWYLDAWEGDGTTAILYGVKLVQGVILGKQTGHRLFSSGMFMFDATDSGIEAGFGDFGTRVLLVHMTPDDVILMGAQPLAAGEGAPT